MNKKQREFIIIIKRWCVEGNNKKELELFLSQNGIPLETASVIVRGLRMVWEHIA